MLDVIITSFLVVSLLMAILIMLLYKFKRTTIALRLVNGEFLSPAVVFGFCMKFPVSRDDSHVLSRQFLT